MAFMKYAKAEVVHPQVSGDAWTKVRVAAKAEAEMSGNLVHQAAEIFGSPFDPKKYLLSHASIVASVDTYEPSGVKTGRVLDGGFRVNRRYANFRVTPETDKYINNNCFIPGTPITMADGTVKPIEDVQVGDRVLTHKGRARRVIETFQHDVDGELLEIKVKGLDDALYATPEHPFFASSVGAGNKAGTFVEAADLTINDSATLPVLPSEQDVGVSLGQARLVGLFAAGGYYELDSQNGNERVGWVFHDDERHTLAKMVHDLVQSEFGVECVVRPHSDDRGAHATTTSQKVVDFFSGHVFGEGAADKRLHGDLITAPLPIQMEILRGWFDGGRSVSDTGVGQDAPGGFQLAGTSASQSLVNQMRILLHRQGISPQMHHIVSEGRRRVVVDGGVRVVFDPSKECHSWALSCEAGCIGELVQDTVYEAAYEKASEVRGGFQWPPDSRFLNDHVLQMFTSIEPVGYRGPVYNFETEEDHSYIAGGVAVHNCDAWDRPVLLKSFKTFVGGHSFVEHVQIEDLSKGRIIDAVSREIPSGESIYVDILIATDKQHRDLVAAIMSGDMSTLSMGCFTPGTLVTMADGRRIPIEDVVPGDMVMTHKGRAREVLNKQIRGGLWSLRRIKAVGVPNIIEATGNHPFLVFRQPDTCACGCREALPVYKGGRKNATRGLKRRFLRGHDKRAINPNGVYSMEEYQERKDQMDAIKLGEGQWVRADELRVGDFVCFPRLQGGQATTDITNGKARLLGYFLAEGSFLKYHGVRKSVQFNFALAEKNTFAAEVMQLLRQEFELSNAPWTFDREDRNTCTVTVTDSAVVDWFFQHGGEYSNSKRLSSDVMAWPVEAHKHLIGAWINGGGHLHGVHQHTSGTTTSYDLACQMHMLMARCGWFAWMEAKVGSTCVEVREIANGGFVRCGVTGGLPHFNLIVGKTQAVGMAPYTDKAVGNAEFGSQGPRVTDDMVMFPITAIEESTYEGFVHNMEVDEDNSYIVEGVASHNCTVDGTQCTKCGHWAADETELCLCVKYAKGNVFFDEEGRKNRVAELCFPPSTRVVLADGSRQAMGDVQVGDMVLTHTGRVQPITKIYNRHYTGDLVTLRVTGLSQVLKSTPNHPYWVVSPNDVCACGCGKRLSTRKNFSRVEYTRKWAQGHHPKGKGVVFLERPTFTFKEAGELQVGDMVALPVPQQVVRPKDVNSDRAHLLGWFLAEGNFTKRKGVRIGVQFTLNPADERDVADEIARLLGQEFAPEDRPTAIRADAPYTPSTVPTTQRVLDYMMQGPCLARNIQQALGLSRRSVESVLTKYREAGIVRSWRPSPEEKSGLDLGGGQIGQAKLWSLVGESTCRRTLRGRKAHLKRTEDLAAGYVKSQPHVYQYDRTEGGEKLVVCYTNRAAARWFFRYAGEYAAHKRLPEGAIHWPLDIQKILLRAYVHGDGGHDAINRFSVSSISDTLISQMQIIAARCGLWSRRQVVFDGKCVEIQSVVNGPDLPIGTDGCRPRHVLYFQPSDGATELFSWGDSGHVRGLAPAWREHDGYFLYRVREVGRETYSGPTCNLEVAGDNSYQVEGMAVHNCGHSSIEPTGGVQFIEASWVKTPAFTGAVMRNVLEPSAETIRQAQAILSVPPADWSPEARQKAAMAIATGVGTASGGFEVGQLESSAAKTGPVREQTIVAAMANDAGGSLIAAEWDNFDEGGGDGGGGGDGEGGGGDDDSEGGEDPLKGLEDELVDHLLNRVKKRVKEDMEGPKDVLPVDSSTKTNDTVIKEAGWWMDEMVPRKRRAAYGGALSTVCRYASSDADLLDKVARLNHDYGLNIEVPLYRAVLVAGKVTMYATPDAFLGACWTAFGRQPTTAEAKTMLRLGKLLSRRGQARRGGNQTHLAVATKE